MLKMNEDKTEVMLTQFAGLHMHNFAALAISDNTYQSEAAKIPNELIGYIEIGLL